MTFAFFAFKQKSNSHINQNTFSIIAKSSEKKTVFFHAKIFKRSIINSL